MKYATPISIVFAGLLIAGGIIYVQTPEVQQDIRDAAKQGEVNVDIRLPDDTDHIYGVKDSPIRIVEYSDIECPFCARLHPVLDFIVNANPGLVSWTYRHLPLQSIHPEAIPAATFSECVAEMDEEMFWNFLDTAFVNQQHLGGQFYGAFAVQARLDPAQLQECVNRGTHEKVIKHTQEAEELGARGTPYTVIIAPDGSNVVVSGAQDRLFFEQIISNITKEFNIQVDGYDKLNEQVIGQ